MTWRSFTGWWFIAARGGPIAAVRHRDVVSIDIDAGRLADDLRERERRCRAERDLGSPRSAGSSPVSSIEAASRRS
jgi:dihydroxyacid dehydratase/phosphogluconate dehydratase